MLLDTSAWIELFKESEKNRRVLEVLGGGGCYTSVVSIAEIANWARRYGKDVALLTAIVERVSTVIKTDAAIAILAGEINYERKRHSRGNKWGMIDSIVLATAHSIRETVLTCDKDFADLPNAEII
ncbi:MAG: PIN domain-containing protein [Candidatus Micrarchaeota archaeon]|nr:PIN domain-containing protein [Candidatus Micrarchaeota archaeon]